MARAEIKARATLDKKNFDTNLARMNQGVQRFSNNTLRQLGGMVSGAFAVGAVVNFTKSQLQAADAAADVARNLGISTEALQALEASAEQYGGTVEQITTALIALRRRQGAAIAGNTGYQKAFERLNITLDDLRKLDTPQLLEKVARGYKEAGQSAQALDAVDQALSESGRRLLGVLVDIADNGLQGIIDQGKRAGTVLSNEVTAELAEANNELEKTERRLKNIATVGLARVIAGIKDPVSLVTASLSGGGGISQFLTEALTGTSLSKKTAKGKAQEDGKIKMPIDEQSEVAVKATAKLVTQAPDQIAKIGGIIGNQGVSNQERMAREQLDLQRKANDKLDMIANASKKTEENTQPLREE